MSTQRRNLRILTFVLFVVMLGHGIIIPILPFYIESMSAGGTELGLLAASYAAMRLIFGPIWGGLSDRVGRKPILLIGILGYVITMIWFGLATRLWMLFAARILAGILSSATAPTTMAYIGDSTSEDERGAGMGLLGAAAGIGTIIGPAVGGVLAGTSLALPFFFAAGLALLSLILAAAFLPESYSQQNQVQAESAVLDLGAWWRALAGPLGTLFVLTFISTSGLMIFASVFGLYGMARFGYGPDQVGLVMMVMGLVSALAQGLLVGPATKRWGDERVIQIGFVATAVGFGVMLLAHTLWGVILTTAFLGLMASIQGPALLSLTSRRALVPQGTAMGLSNSFVSLGRIVGPLWAGFVFDRNIAYPYLSGVVLLLSGFALSLRWLARETAKPATVVH